MSLETGIRKISCNPDPNYWWRFVVVEEDSKEENTEEEDTEEDDTEEELDSGEIEEEESLYYEEDSGCSWVLGELISQG